MNFGFSYRILFYFIGYESIIEGVLKKCVSCMCWGLLYEYFKVFNIVIFVSIGTHNIINIILPRILIIRRKPKNIITNAIINCCNFLNIFTIIPL